MIDNKEIFNYSEFVEFAKTGFDHEHIEYRVYHYQYTVLQQPRKFMSIFFSGGL